MGNLHLRFDEGRGTFPVPSYSTRFRQLVGQTSNPGAGDYRRVIPAIPPRASTTSPSDKKRSIRLAAVAGTVKAARGAAAPVMAAATPAERLQSEFRLYLRQERALVSTTQVCYTAFVREFLVERFGAGPVDLSRLSAADVTGYVRRRAGTIHSKLPNTLPHVRANELDLRPYLRAHHRKEFLEGLYRPFLAHPQQSRTAQVDLIHQGQIFVPFASLNLIHANGANRSQDAMLQPPSDQILHRVVDLIPGSAKLLGGFLPGEFARPMPQKMRCEPWSRCVSPCPAALLRLPPRIAGN